jgi:hypothetical protein
MSGLNGLPRWWLSLVRGEFSATLMLDLMGAVDRAGVARNDRVGVERIWQERQRGRALARVLQAESLHEGASGRGDDA